MEKEIKLSDTLRTFRALRGESLAEFSSEVGIPKSTVQSIIKTGNASLDTLIRISDRLGVSLDILVFGSDSGVSEAYTNWMPFFLRGAECFDRLSQENQKRLCYHLSEILRLMEGAVKP